MFELLATLLCGSLLMRCAAAAEHSPRAAARTVTLPLYADSGHLGYYANITVGTPPQNVRVSIDTGSADLWIFSNNVNCTPSTACQGSSFNPDASSSFQDVAPGEFLVNYAGGNGAAGDFISETVQIGGATVKNVILGLATQAGSPNGLPVQGIMGLGMLFDEALRTENGTGYFNLLYRLAAEGIIDEAVFSIYLDDISSQASSLLFGGIDTDKYTGELAVFDITAEKPGLVEYLLPITSISLAGSAGNTTAVDVSSSSSSSNGGGFPALLDTGSTAMSLPVDIVEQIYNQYPIAETNIGPVVNCDLANDGGSIAFQFGGSSGPTINVGLAEIVRHSALIGNPNVCFFDIFPQSQGEVAVLGDSFLRSVYAVFDPSNAQIGLAQAKLNAANTNNEALSANAPVPTGEAIVPLQQLGNGASFGGGIPGSAVGSAVAATAPARVTAVQTPALLQSSAAIKTTLATGASAATAVLSMPASASASYAAGGSPQATTAPAKTTAAPEESSSSTSTSTSAIPRFSGAAVKVSHPEFFSLLAALVGVLAFA